MLVVNKLNKSFNELTVLNDCSFQVNDASIFGLIGINGAGKSTLLRIIADVIEADSGEVIFNGKDTKKDADIRKDIIFIAENPYFPFGSSINSMKSFYQSFYDFDEETFQYYLKLFKLDPKRQVSEFSKGMKRQASLLFALACQPKLLLLDEAFDGLDPLIRLNFKKALANLISEKGVSVIISSHNLKEMEDICDSFALLENGNILSSGDLWQEKENINRYQLAFKEAKTEEDFKQFDVLNYENVGQVYTLVIRGEYEEVTSKLEKMNPLICNSIGINFEELFIYELESRQKYE